MSGVQQAVFQNQRSFGLLDAQFNYVTMLLHGDGTNGAQNNTFLDSSSNAFSITRNGNTTQGSFSPYGPNWSNYFNGNSYFILPANSGFDYGTGDYTIEGWIYSSSLTWSLYATGGGGSSDQFSCDSGNLYWGYGITLFPGGGISSFFTSADLNQWVHVAMCRSSGTTRAFKNGVVIATSTVASAIGSSTNQPFIAERTDNAYPLNGYMSNLRIVKGTAVYTSAFTPPITPLTAISGTSLLTCQSNRFKDNSSNNFSFTVNGTPSVQRFNPFGTSTAYDTSVIGGSGYFDGSGDYLSTANSSAFAFGTGNFTLEFWYRGTSTTGGFGLPTGGSSGYWQLNLYASVMYWQDVAGSSNLLSVSASPILNGAWNHVAVVRNSTTTTIYFNGVSVTSASDTTNYSGTGGDFRLGFDTNSNYIAGYIANYRIVKGTAVYTANFTPPTAPLTAISGTSLLLNYTNGAIYDNAMMNNLETVGNAQISTSVVKYGTGSLAFDGTGDWLIMPYGPTQNFSTGSFTIEMWAYLNSLAASYYVPAGTWGAGTSDEWLIQIRNDGYIRFLTTAGSTFYSASITTATWYHIAIVRSGSTVTIYVNGTSVGSYTCSNSLGSVAKTLYIGSQAGTHDWNGYIDDFRITNGYARYTATFTPPTSAFSNIGPY